MTMPLHAVSLPFGKQRTLGAFVDQYVTDMRIAGYSEVTIKDRSELIGRFRDTLNGKPLLEATEDDLRAFQATFSHLAPASKNIYSRHLKAFYDWASDRGIIETNPARRLVVPRVPRGRPHPASVEDLQVIFACTTGPLRLAYVLAAFAGLRRGEICRLQRSDIDMNGQLSVALINGKGGHQRTVPFLTPVVDELHEYGLSRSGPVLRKRGREYRPDNLSVDSCEYLHGLGLTTTLHSMRSTFATNAARMTRDPLFVRDLLGHASVQTTERYMDSTMQDSHMRLAGLSTLAGEMLRNRPAAAEPVLPTIRAVRS